MTAEELMNALFAWCKEEQDFELERTCDTLKCGDGSTTLKKVVVTMHATVELIRQAQEWGAQMIIVHEPTFYDHWDEKMTNDPVTDAKAALLEQSGIVLWRFHDYPHKKYQDMIREGNCRSLGLKGKCMPSGFYANTIIHLDEPVKISAIANRYRELGADNLRVCGNQETMCKKIALAFGTPGGVWESLINPEIDAVLVGEGCEWRLGEYARDAGQLGMNKALMIIGHIVSEREGMKYLAEILQERYAGEFETRYMECGEVYKHY